MEVDFEKLLIGVSCLIFILVFGAVLFCLTDFKLCFKNAPKQRIFHDSVLTNKVALQEDNNHNCIDSHKNSGGSGKRVNGGTPVLSKTNRTHPSDNLDNISDDTIDLSAVQENGSLVKCNSVAVEVSSNSRDSLAVNEIDGINMLSAISDKSLVASNTVEIVPIS